MLPLIDRIAGTAENQPTGSGGFHGGTTSKTVLRDALLLELRGINWKAGAMADADDPKHSGFSGLGHDPAFVGQPRDQITAFEQVEETQDAGPQAQAGAPAEFGHYAERRRRR